MKESILYHILKENAKHTNFYRVENTIELGTPDIHFVNRAVSGWIEAKQVKLPVQSSTPVHIPFRPSQYMWLKNYKAAGGIALLGIVVDGFEQEGFFFAEGVCIQQEYQRNMFTDAYEQRYSLLTFVHKGRMDDFFLHELTRLTLLR